MGHLEAESFFFKNVFIKEVVGHNLQPSGYQNSSTFMQKITIKGEKGKFTDQN